MNLILSLETAVASAVQVSLMSKLGGILVLVYMQSLTLLTHLLVRDKQSSFLHHKKTLLGCFLNQ